jgi:hypothetical protein
MSKRAMNATARRQAERMNKRRHERKATVIPSGGLGVLWQFCHVGTIANVSTETETASI